MASLFSCTRTKVIPASTKEPLRGFFAYLYNLGVGKKKKSIFKRDVNEAWHHWRYKNTLLLILSIVLFYFLSKTPWLKNGIDSIGNLGYLGALITGIFFVSTFTVVPASVVLFNLANNYHPIEVAVLAGLGAMIGDYIIFRFMKDKIFEEMAPFFQRIHKNYLRSLFKSPYFSWFLPVIGAAIIASPIPDEAGVSMLGLSKIRPWQFFIVTFALNTIGILLIVTASRLI